MFALLLAQAAGEVDLRFLEDIGLLHPFVLSIAAEIAVKAHWLPIKMKKIAERHDVDTYMLCTIAIRGRFWYCHGV